MKTTKLALAVMLATGLAAAPLAAEAKSHKKHHSSMSQTTTGANMKKTVAPDASGQGGSGPGSDQGGSMTKPQNGMSK
ncbi:hypothetical protein [Bradyrhizobium sp. LB11.1]|uniref:hypothetical protein n=1 Tax=Bradyrhizobium sp. LB11.1 TaxID=3156326 RepID=UPI003399F7A4